MLPDDDKRYAIETCRSSESVLKKWFKNKWHTISAFVGCVIISKIIILYRQQKAEDKLEWQQSSLKVVMQWYLIYTNNLRLPSQQQAVSETCSAQLLSLLQLAIPVHGSPQHQCTLCRYDGKLILTVVVNEMTHTLKHAILSPHLQAQIGTYMHTYIYTHI